MSFPQDRYHDFASINNLPDNGLLMAAKRQAQPRHTPRIKLNTICEKQSIAYNQVSQCWAMVTLQVDPIGKNPQQNVFVDFVVCVDLSASMSQASKLAFVLASIEYLLDRLDERHRFSLIVFNHTVCELTDLIVCTESNKQQIKQQLKGLNATGSTNIAGAVFQAISVLNRRNKATIDRIASVMLFTDGIQSRPTGETLAQLERLQLPRGCVVNTFGYGQDHDSRMLHGIARRSNGIYYFVENQDAIAATFGECVAGILSTEAYQIVVTLRGQDGARIVTLATPYAITEHLAAKHYDLRLGLMYSGESKSILLKMSLRGLQAPQPRHTLAMVRVEYLSTHTMRREVITGAIITRRPQFCPPEAIPLNLDQNINRYATAVTIQDAIAGASRGDLRKGQALIQTLSRDIRKSASAHQPYCQDLLKDIDQVMRIMSSVQNFRAGIHLAYSYCAMYYMERSNGAKVTANREGRHAGYGYVTVQQELESRNAVALTRSYVSGYSLRRDPMDMDL